MITGCEERFVAELRAAEMHCPFVQGSQAARAEPWLPSVGASLTGVENSVRVTVGQLEGRDIGADQELGANLSNALLRRASEKGLPISELALPGEENFNKKLALLDVCSRWVPALGAFRTSEGL